MSIKIIAFILGLILTWIGITLISSLIMAFVITVSETTPHIIYFGIVSLILGLAIIYKISKPVFQQITKLNSLFKMMRGGGLV